MRKAFDSGAISPHMTHFEGEDVVALGRCGTCCFGLKEREKHIFLSARRYLLEDTTKGNKDNPCTF